MYPEQVAGYPGEIKAPNQQEQGGWSHSGAGAQTCWCQQSERVQGPGSQELQHGGEMAWEGARPSQKQTKGGDGEELLEGEIEQEVTRRPF